MTLRTLALALSLLAVNNALACKPCESGLEYSVRNNRIILLGKAVSIGKAPANVLARNTKKKSMYEHEAYAVPVTIEIEEVLAGGDATLKPGARYETQSMYNPPCKDLALPKLGERALFFPEDYGNCSSFSFVVREGQIEGRPLAQIRALAAKTSL